MFNLHCHSKWTIFCLVTFCITAGKCYRHKQTINLYFISQAEKHERKKAGFCKHIQIHTFNETEFSIKFQRIPLKSLIKDFEVSPLKFNYSVSKRSIKTWPVMSMKHHWHFTMDICWVVKLAAYVCERWKT